MSLVQIAEDLSRRAEYVTLTVVIRQDEDLDDPCENLVENALRKNPDILFVGHESGVSRTALQLGADPESWD